MILCCRVIGVLSIRCDPSEAKKTFLPFDFASSAILWTILTSSIGGGFISSPMQQDSDQGRDALCPHMRENGRYLSICPSHELSIA